MQVVTIAVADDLDQPIPRPVSALIVKGDFAGIRLGDSLDSKFDAEVEITKSLGPKVYDVMNASVP